jgi:hypothetical protein
MACAPIQIHTLPIMSVTPMANKGKVQYLSFQYPAQSAR